MEQSNSSLQMLDLLNYPCIAVSDGQIIHINEPAKDRMFRVGMDIHELLFTGEEEYRSFTDGCLYLRLCVACSIYDAAVICVDGMHFFLMEHSPAHTELQAIALASQQLRMPLSDIIAASDQLLPSEMLNGNEAAKEQISQINRSIHQLLRLIGNMSDAARYLDENNAHQVSHDLSAIIAEVMEKSATLLKEAGYNLNFTGLNQPVYALADNERLERAVYNLVSNAVKFSSKCATITASLTQKRDFLYFTISNPGDGVSPEVRGNMFSRFLRAPALNDYRTGIGLGMVIVHAAASAHGGTVLVENPIEGGTRITMTLKLRENPQAIVRSNLFTFDYAGGHDHGLLELSDILPHTSY